MYLSDMYEAENVTSKIAWIVADQIRYEGIRPNVRKKILKMKSLPNIFHFRQIIAYLKKSRIQKKSKDL